MESISKVIANLQVSDLVAECPNCSEEFSLSKALLFDGKKEFPETAQKIRQELQSELNERIVDLKKRNVRADKSAEIGAISSGFGKIIEKILPAYKNFNMPLNDCRFIGEPIDMVIFQGSSEMKINHITFMDVKTGKGRLDEDQKSVRDAVLDHRVKCEMI